MVLACAVAALPVIALLALGFWYGFVTRTVYLRNDTSRGVVIANCGDPLSLPAGKTFGQDMDQTRQACDVYFRNSSGMPGCLLVPVGVDEVAVSGMRRTPCRIPQSRGP